MDERIPLMIFRVGRLTLAIPTACVGIVQPWRPTIPIPRVREFVLGAVTWRDRLIPAVDLAGMLGAPPTPARLCVVVRAGASDIAFPVTRVDAMPSLVLDDFVHSGFREVSIPGRYVRAVGLAADRHVIVLNLFAVADRLNFAASGAPR